MLFARSVRDNILFGMGLSAPAANQSTFWCFHRARVREGLWRQTLLGGATAGTDANAEGGVGLRAGKTGTVAEEKRGEAREAAMLEAA